MHFTIPDVIVHGEMTCLVVAGNVAGLTGVVINTSEKTLLATGTKLHWLVQDNGEGSNSPNAYRYSILTVTRVNQYLDASKDIEIAMVAHAASSPRFGRQFEQPAQPRICCIGSSRVEQNRTASEKRFTA